MSTVLSRFRSLERHLWWDIDSTVVGDTGCIPPCTHDLYEMAIADGFNLVETSYYTAGYDSPYVFVNRRNEVWWIIADE